MTAMLSLAGHCMAFASWHEQLVRTVSLKLLHGPFTCEVAKLLLFSFDSKSSLWWRRFKKFFLSCSAMRIMNCYSITMERVGNYHIA